MTRRSARRLPSSARAAGFTLRSGNPAGNQQVEHAVVLRGAALPLLCAAIEAAHDGAAVRDDRAGSPSHGEINSFVLSARNPATLVVPPGVYHGWMALEDDTQLVSVGSELYDPNNLDEVRVPYTSFGYDWSVQHR